MISNKKSFLFLSLIFILTSCISASSQTGGEQTTSTKMKQDIEQKSTTSDTTSLKIDSTTIEEFDKEGKLCKKTVLGGGSAEAGRELKQQSETLSEISNKLNQQQKAISDAKIDTTPLYVILGLLVLASVGSRLLPLLKKFMV